MQVLQDIHMQELSDILISAHSMFDEKVTDIQINMFRSMFGGLFCEPGARFGEKIGAYEANRKSVPLVLAEIAIELDRRIQ